MSSTKTISSLEAMKSLLEQSQALVLQQQKELKEEKADLVKKALKKINSYLDSVLLSMPFNMVNVELKENLMLLLRKEHNCSHIRKEDSETKIHSFYIFSKGNGGYYSTNKNYVGSKFQDSYWIQGILYIELIQLVNEFDSFKEKIESTILAKAHSIQTEQLQKMQKEEDSLAALRAFVD